MLWVCRAGKQACYINDFFSNNKIYIPWTGFDENMTNFQTIDEFKNVVISEQGNDIARTSLSNWASQLQLFAISMNKGDYVLIPEKNSHSYHLAIIIGNYSYTKDAVLHHSRKVEFIAKSIPREIFNQSIKYSLGAYRTLFKVKQEKEVMNIISKWKKQNNASQKYDF